MEVLLPEKSMELSKWIEQLPYNDISPAYPFSGVVVNTNIATRAHRDPGDDEICMVLTISDCVGGDIVLFELGLVIETRSGDAEIFRSTDQTHFNLDFNGLRASLVLHSDRAGKRWNDDANGWAHNQYFSRF
jgi:hypothetical protein